VAGMFQSIQLILKFLKIVELQKALMCHQNNMITDYRYHEEIYKKLTKQEKRLRIMHFSCFAIMFLGVLSIDYLLKQLARIQGKKRV
jgi:hypothetical protein